MIEELDGEELETKNNSIRNSFAEPDSGKKYSAFRQPYVIPEDDEGVPEIGDDYASDAFERDEQDSKAASRVNPLTIDTKIEETVEGEPSPVVFTREDAVKKKQTNSEKKKELALKKKEEKKRKLDEMEKQYAEKLEEVRTLMKGGDQKTPTSV